MSEFEPIQFPEIRFKNGALLTRAFNELIRQIPDQKDSQLAGWEEINQTIEKNRSLWKDKEVGIVTAMQKIAGLNFYKNLIDVYLVDGHKSGFSDPLVLSYKYHGEGFIDVMAHELLHVLLTDNKQGRDGSVWARRAYPEIEDRLVTNHILVHAIHKEIYLNTLKRPDRLKHDIEKCQKWPAYKTSWEIVERDGHINIIEGFKKSKTIQ
jgi:hypothetical protein